MMKTILLPFKSKPAIAILVVIAMMMSFVPMTAIASSPRTEHCICGGISTVGDHTSCEDVTWTKGDGTTTIPTSGNITSDNSAHTCSYTYAVNTENVAQIIESCTCGHRETATIELNSEVPDATDAAETAPLKVTYSEGWAGDRTAEISYSNNPDNETATGSLTISGQTATRSFTILKISKMRASDPHSHPICGDRSCSNNSHAVSGNWTAWDGKTTITYNNRNTASVYLSGNVELGNPLSVTAGKTLNLCLNGHTLSYKGSKADSGILTVPGNGVLNLCSCEKGGKMKRTSQSTDMPLISAPNKAKVNLYNVTLDGGAVWTGTEDKVLKRGTNNTGIRASKPLIDAGVQRKPGGKVALYSGVYLQNNVCSSSGDGGAVTIGEDGTLDIDGAVIRNNGKTSENAGAVKAYAGATLTMTRGEIYGNYANGHGGAIQIFGGDSTSKRKVNFTMSGGTIRNNKARGVGGAIAVSDYSSFTMSGGEIKDNQTLDSNKRGGGVGFVDSNTDMTLSGDVIITGNKAGNDTNNLCVGNKTNNKVTIGNMTNKARVGVTMINKTGVFSNGGKTNINQFKSDKLDYVVEADGNNLKLVPHTHSYTYAGNPDNPAQIIGTCGTCGNQETATLELKTNVSTVYTGSGITPLQVNYSSGWAGAKPTSISYSENINVGTATGSVTIEGVSATMSFTITKKSADAPTPPTAENRITYGAKLSAVRLTDGWSWVNGDNITPDAGTRSYTAYYTPTDTTNYDWTHVEGWNDAKGRVERTVDVTVYKATPAPDDYTVPENVTATYGDTLADVTLPAGWTWKDPTTNVDNVGTMTFVAIFTPTDTNNFDTVEVDVTVTVSKADSTYTAPTAIQDLMYTGKPIRPIAGGAAQNGTMMYAKGANATTVPTSDWSEDIPEVRDAGAHYIWYKVEGNDNYNGVEPACIPVTVKKALLTVTANNIQVTYGDPPPGYSASYSGFVSGENESVLTGKLAFDCKYEQFDKVLDQHSINPGGLSSDNYNITFENGMLTVGPKTIGIDWSNTALTYNGKSQTPTATATGTVNGDVIFLTVDGAQTDVSDDPYTATVTEITGYMSPNYRLPDTDNRSTTFTIGKAGQNAPTVVGVAETIFGKRDGRLTGVTEAMEYRAKRESTYHSITGDSVEGLAAGTYYVRVKGDGNHNASPDTEVTIVPGRKLTVTLPQNPVGYTLEVDKTEFEYMDSLKITLNILEGYSKASNFAVKLNGTDINWGDNTEFDTPGFGEDVVITVEGVVDITTPEAKITIKDSTWTSFLNNLTFGLFFKETQDVTITATDAGSGINTIEYYLADSKLELDEVKEITGWKLYNDTFRIEPNNRYVVYAKVTDNAGNTLYINSDGITLDNIAPTLGGIENGRTYYGDLTVIKSNAQLHDIKIVTLDGEEMDFAEGTYGLIPADNEEHIIVVEDYAGNTTTYTVRVMKNYTVTYIADGVTVATQTVGHGQDAIVPGIPVKDGYTQTAPTWDKDGKNITADTEINAVYTINVYTITFMDENGVYTTLTYKHGETVTMPDVPKKNGYTVKWETTIDKATEDAVIKAVYTKNPENHKTDTTGSPQTGDNSNLWLWVALLFVSGGCLSGITLIKRRRKATLKKKK